MTLRRSEIHALLLLLWAVVSLLWTPDRGQGMFQVSHAVLAVCAFALVIRLPEKAIEWAVLPGVLLALIGHYVLLYVLPSEWWGAFGNKNFGAEFLMGAIPLGAVALWNTKLRHSCWVIALLGVVCLFTVYSAANAKYVALLTLGMCAAIWLVARRLYLTAAILVLVPIDAMVLWGYSAWSLASLRVRIELWSNTLALWLEKPLLGHGFGSFNHEYPRYQEFHLSLFPEMGSLLNQPAMFSGQAHSEPLQLLAELGIVGFLLAAVFLIDLLRQGTRAGKLAPRDYGALASIALLGGSGLVGFPLQNPATILLAVIALGLIARRETIAVSVNCNRWLRLAATLPIVTGLCWVAWLHNEARASFTQVRARMEQNDLPGSFVANLRAIEIFPWDWLPKYQLALTLTALAVHDQKSVIEPAAGDRVFDLSRSVAPDAPVISYARLAYLDAANRVEEAAEEIEQILASLKINASLQPSTWLAEQWYAERIGDRPRAAFAAFVASTPGVMRQAGHFYPSEFRDHLNRLARAHQEGQQQ